MTPQQAANRAKLSHWWHRQTGCRLGRHRETVVSGVASELRWVFTPLDDHVESVTVPALCWRCVDCPAARPYTVGIVPSRRKVA